jgi:hypothetical protein
VDTERRHPAQGRAFAISAAVAVLVAAAIVALATAPESRSAKPARQALATCFWEGPISTKRPTTRGFDGRNFNFPEESATYWLARFSLPEGAKLVLRGRYPYGRYMSLNAYSDAVPTDALSDIAIRPRSGHTNPFVAGNRRDLRKRSWRVEVLDEPPPGDSADRRPNTIYARPQGGAAIELAYRVYEPDRGLGLTGGTGLPKPSLVLADGTALAGKAACARANDPNREITLDTTPESQWDLRHTAPGCDPQTNPAYGPPRWERFFTYLYAALSVLTDCTPAGREARHAVTPAPEVANYANKDSAYVYAHLSRQFGEVVVLRGRLPRFPKTRDGQRVMRRGQLRFWSLCTGESRVTVRTPDCLADRQVPIDRKRRYTIVVSKRADRPANARPRCGVGWLDWGERGDGVGDPDYGLLLLRNMLVSPRFAEAIQNVERAGTEPDVMGEYLPTATYATRAEFESQGC